MSHSKMAHTPTQARPSIQNRYLMYISNHPLFTPPHLSSSTLFYSTHHLSKIFWQHKPQLLHIRRLRPLAPRHNAVLHPPHLCVQQLRLRHQVLQHSRRHASRCVRVLLERLEHLRRRHRRRVRAPRVVVRRRCYQRVPARWVSGDSPVQIVKMDERERTRSLPPVPASPPAARSY